jgi:hypothetical protein
VSDRDAGSLEMVTVVKDLSTIEELPASHPTNAAHIMQSTSFDGQRLGDGYKLVDGRAKHDHDELW